MHDLKAERSVGQNLARMACLGESSSSLGKLNKLNILDYRDAQKVKIKNVDVK